MLNPSTGLWNGGVSREGYKRIRNKVKSQESGQIHFQISSEEQRPDVCGHEKKISCWHQDSSDGGKYVCLGKFSYRSFGSRRCGPKGMNISSK